MRPGFLSFPSERILRFESEPQVIDTTNGNSFAHPFGRIPQNVSVMLLCVIAANGFSVGEEIPIQMLFQDAATSTDGRPRYNIRISSQRVLVLIQAGGGTHITDSTVANAAFTSTNYRLKVRCSDVLPIS